MGSDSVRKKGTSRVAVVFGVIVVAVGVLHKVRNSDWTMADDGSVYTLPIGSTEIKIGRIKS